MDTQHVCQLHSNSFANGANDRRAYPKFWIAALVQMNCEKKAVDKLNKLGFETFLPIQKEERQWSDRRKIINRIVIPMVIFIRVAPKEDESIRNYSFIHKLLTLPGSKQIATPIPDIQIENLRFLLSMSEEEVSIASDLHIGDMVKVIDGPLKGLIGELVITNNSKDVVAIRINGLGYACVNIEKSYLKLI